MDSAVGGDGSVGGCMGDIVILPAETMTAAPAPTSVGPTAAVATVAILVMGLGTPTVGVLQDGRMTVEVTACGDNA